MIRICLILAMLLFMYCLLRDFLEPPAEENLRFDWEAYNRDIQDGVDCQTQMAKLKNGAYMTSEPCKVIDLERYYYDLKVYGREVVERKRRDGEYTFVCKSIDQRIYEREKRKRLREGVAEKKSAH